MLLKKIWIWLVFLATITLLVILGMQCYFLFANYKVNKDQLEIQYGKEDERRKKIAEEESRRKAEDALRKAQLSKLAGFNPEGKATILDPKNIDHLGIRNHPSGIKCELGEKAPTLIYEDEVNFHFQDILNDIIICKNGEELKPDGFGDNFSKQLKRNNCILYGAPGTGKTVFVDELVHHLYAEFGQKVEKKVQKLEEEIAQLKQEREVMDANGQDVAERTDEEEEERDKKIKDINNRKKIKEDELAELESVNMTPPIIQIRGEKLKSAGGIDPNAAGVADKFLEVVKHYKEKAFGDPFSDEPYIVFVEEADQGVDVMGGTGGKKNFLLEEYKNFLSTSEDKAGLKSDAQDPNSVIIVATNNFDLIDPAVYRRGRLGKKLCFDWTPEILKKYGEEGDNNWRFKLEAGTDTQAWPVVNWPKNDPSWQFEGNANYGELCLMSKKFGFAAFKNEFARPNIRMNETIGKANQIIESYKKLTPEEKKNKEDNELGGMPTGRKIPTGNKIKKRDGTEVDEMKRETVCNWLLHFLYTFHWYNADGKTKNFTSASQIKRYDFGNDFYLREAVQDVYKQIGMEVEQVGAVYNILTDVDEDLKNIYGLMVQTQNFRQEFLNLKATVTDVEKAMAQTQNDIMGNLKILENQIQRIGSNSANSNDITGLNNRISRLESRIGDLQTASVSSGPSGSSGGISVNEYNEKINKLNNLKDAVNELMRALKRNETNLDSYFDRINSCW